jgi:internalin A
MSTVVVAGLRLDTNTKALDLANIKGPLKALPDLSALKKLERLAIRKPLASLDGIEACPALRVVELAAPVRDLSALAKAKKLVWMSVEKLSSFADLPALPNVTSISAFRAGVKSLRGIERFPSLETLNIDQGAPGDLSKLAPLKKLTYLSAVRCKVRSLNGVPRSIETLDLRDNALASLDGIEKLTKLVDLFLDNNKLTRIPNLSALRKLETLSLEGNRILRLENLEGLRSLTSLDIDGDDMTSVAPRTAAWLRKRNKSFELHASPKYLKTKVEKWLGTKPVSS